MHNSEAPLPGTVDMWSRETKCPRCGGRDDVTHDWDVCMQAQLDQQKRRIDELERRLAEREGNAP